MMKQLSSMKDNKYPGYKKLEIRQLQLLQLSAMKELHQFCIAHGITYYIIRGTLLGAVRHKGFIPWDDDIDIAMMREDYEKFKHLFPKVCDQTKFFLQHYKSDVDFGHALMRVCIKGTVIDKRTDYYLNCCKNTFIDIFPLDDVSDCEWQKKIHVWCVKSLSNLIDYHLYKEYVCQNKLRGMIKKSFHSIVSLIPLSFYQNIMDRVIKLYMGKRTKEVACLQNHYSYKMQTMPRTVYGKPVLLSFEDTELYAPENYTQYLTKLYGKSYMQMPPPNKREKPTDVYIKIDLSDIDEK